MISAWVCTCTGTYKHVRHVPKPTKCTTNCCCDCSDMDFCTMALMEDSVPHKDGSFTFHGWIIGDEKITHAEQERHFKESCKALARASQVSFP